jgi:hypothetical protein
MQRLDSAMPMCQTIPASLLHTLLPLKMIIQELIGYP